ncbi:MAG TPA: TonB-dependent receptor, partial [Povalibacter sp.]|nr:TonB-dependent receptor [Povalibacter sp.]
LEKTGAQEFADYAAQIPSLSYNDLGPGDKKYVIRGITSTGPATVGVYYDESVITGANANDGGGRQPDIRLFDLDRIEVLKGPQGTLFGKNTSAGVINVVTKKPSFDFGSDVELTAGNYGALEGAASLTGPFSQTVAGRLYVAARERDGFIDVDRGPGPRTAAEDVDRSFYTARGQLLFQPSNALDIRLTGDYSKRDENCCAAPQAVLTPVPGVLTVLNALQPGSVTNPADPFARKAHSNRGTEQRVTDEGASVEVNWDMNALGGATLTSITAWRNWETVNGQDADFTTVDILYREDDGDFANELGQLSEELRLAGEAGKINWLFGAFYASEDLDSRNQLIYGNQFRAYYNALLSNALASLPANAWPGGLGTRDVYSQDSTSWALFTNNSIRFTDAIEFTLGLRYTDESKDLDTQYFNEHGGVGCSILRSIPAFVNSASAATIFGIGCATYADPIFNDLATKQSISESEWSGTAKLAFRFNDAAMAYVSYARGYKASGFNLDRERIGDSRIAPNPANPAAIQADTDTSFAKELVDSYELGLKTQWANDTLLLNGAVFYQDYTDFQLNTFTGIQFVVTSLPKVNSQGVDLDVVWYTPLQQLSLQGGVTYANTEIKEFGSAAVFFRPEREDDRLSFAPKWSGSLSATFDQPIATNMVFRANLGARYVSEYNTGSNLDPRKIQDAYTLLNARIGIGSSSESWMFEAWAQNLTDEDYYQVAFDATLQGSSASQPAPTSTVNAFLGAPRTYGVTARFRF